MKTLFVAIFTLFIASAAAAQDLPSKTLTRGTWELGAFAGGGEGFGKSDNTQFLIAGGRGGLVLTKEFMPGILRGNFEWAVDVMPVYIVFPPNSGVYGGSIKPVIWKWNFTHWQKVAPYFAAAGGILFTRQNIPPGDTSQVNFTPQADFGVHIFLREGRAITLEMDAVHHSNASLGNQNPGYNGSYFFTVGYTWFKTHK
ncbi:MAG TPA: acyloxyacyl hydrolase [Candidatus Acidoferrales bacterium]|nr:acyloxyacyl hydrolase [Candidatus Acidoferrales bacterium]